MGTEPKDLARACATLGLPRNTSLKEAGRAYKRLVRRWHPDRFAADPQGQAEAASRLREINRAFAVVRESLAGDRYPATGAATNRPAAPAPVRSTEGPPRSSSLADDLSQAMDVESDAAALGRIVYWGIVLGLAVLLIWQSSRSAVRVRSAPATIAGIIALAVAAGRFLMFLIRKWRER